MAKDPSGIRLLQRHLKQLSAMVPLENAASGLIVFTQDWRIERKLEEDMGAMEHEVMVDVKGEVSDQALRLLNRLQDSDADLPQTKVSLNSNTEDRSTLRFAIKGAHRGLIAHLCCNMWLLMSSIDVNSSCGVSCGTKTFGCRPSKQSM